MGRYVRRSSPVKRAASSGFGEAATSQWRLRFMRRNRSARDRRCGGRSMVRANSSSECFALAPRNSDDRPGRGRFITFEGGEGSGKSTHIKMLAERLNAAKLRAMVTREPGGSPGAEIMRHLVLSGMGKLLGPDAG